MVNPIDFIRQKYAKHVVAGIKAAATIAKQRLNALDMFRPTAYQEAVVKCQASEMLIRGGTRSGKSTIIAVMIAAYLLDLPITFADGTKHRVREEEFRGRAVTCWLIGLQLNHVGQTIHRLLCKAGAFEIVRDPKTGLWRAWDPARYPDDAKIPPSERKPAPPLLPPSTIRKEVWDNKAKYEFASLEMNNGSIAYAYASTAAVKRGDPVNRIWIDEEIADSTHYPEWQSRLSDRKGRIWWSSWPEMKAPALLQLYRRSNDQMEEVIRGERAFADVVNFRFRGSDNPFIEENEKRKRVEGWTEEQRLARDEGHFVTDTIVAYPEFDRRLHCVSYGNSPLNDRITEIINSLNGTVPKAWSVDLILDPGTRRPALLWGAVPPPELWHHGQPYYIVFKELAVPRIDAMELAKRAKFMEPGRIYNRFIIDKKAGDQTSMGASYDVAALYSQAFKQAGLRCRLTGDMFLPSTPHWVIRSMKLRGWMNGRDCGRPQLRIMVDRCPVLVRQLEEVQREVTKEDVKDKLASGQIHDVLDTLEYWAGSDPFYRPAPVEVDADPSGFNLYNAEVAFWAGRAAKQPQSDERIVLGL